MPQHSLILHLWHSVWLLTRSVSLALGEPLQTFKHDPASRNQLGWPETHLPQAFFMPRHAVKRQAPCRKQLSVGVCVLVPWPLLQQRRHCTTCGERIKGHHTAAEIAKPCKAKCLCLCAPHDARSYVHNMVSAGSSVGVVTQHWQVQHNMRYTSLAKPAEQISDHNAQIAVRVHSSMMTGSFARKVECTKTAQHTLSLQSLRQIRRHIGIHPKTVVILWKFCLGFPVHQSSSTAYLILGVF